MYLSIVTDEVSSDPITAVELAQEWGIHHIELRSVSSGRLPNISDADRRKLDHLAKRDDLKITAISPGFFKDPLDSDTTKRQRDDELPKAIELATSLGIAKMVFFAVRKDDRPRDEVVPQVAALIRDCAETLADEKIQLLLENEHICWGDTGENTVEIIKQANHPNIKLNWDPCNTMWGGGSPFPHEYKAVKDFIGHLHVKDARLNRFGKFEGIPIGEGDVPWRDILKVLRHDGYEGPYTVETHYSPKVSGSRRCAENLKRLLLEIG